MTQKIHRRTDLQYQAKQPCEQARLTQSNPHHSGAFQGPQCKSRIRIERKENRERGKNGTERQMRFAQGSQRLAPHQHETEHEINQRCHASRPCQRVVTKIFHQARLHEGSGKRHTEYQSGIDKAFELRRLPQRK